METLPMRSPNAVVAVVDDDEAVLDSLLLLLEAAGFDACGYPCGEDLLNACAPGPDGKDCAGGCCLVLDVHLPGLDGFAILDAMRERCPQAPVILMTGRSDGLIRDREMAAGVAPVLEKPLGRGVLVAAVRAALAAHA